MRRPRIRTLRVASPHRSLPPAAAATAAEWQVFVRKYRGEMAAPENARTIALLAALSHQTDFSVGCYSAEETRCHRSLLRELLLAAGAEVAEEAAGEAPGRGRSRKRAD